MPAKVQSPEKELRFTRAGQAPGFWVMAAVLFSAGVTIVATGVYRDINPALPHPAWALLLWGLAGLAVRLAVRLTRHAYLILTPLGLEIFPFFRPAAGMQLVTWQEIAAAEVDGEMRTLTLHYNAEKTAGIHLSLGPISKDRRALLAKAIAGRVCPGRAGD